MELSGKEILLYGILLVPWVLLVVFILATAFRIDRSALWRESKVETPAGTVTGEVGRHREPEPHAAQPTPRDTGSTEEAEALAERRLKRTG